MTDNRIVTENAIMEGRAESSYWNVAHSNQIEGFATDFSVNAGDTVDFKINVNGGAGSDYTVEIFRLGHYGGSGAREVAEWTNQNATVQEAAQYDPTRALVDAGNWTVTDSWDIPADAVSGVYLARLQRLDANGDPIEGAVNQIPFIVRNDGVSADIVLQTSDTTWHAYNGWFGNNGQVGANFYGDASLTVSHDDSPPDGGRDDRSYAVSYNRPFITRDGTSPSSGAQNYVFGADYAAISWLEQNGYDVSYISGVDTDRLGADYLQNYKAFISVGHDEYWSGGQRANVEEARDAGVNLLFWSGNECYWKTRWDVSIVDGTEYRTLVCYKETWANPDPNDGPDDYVDLDPTNIWTGTWRDTRFLMARDAEGNYIAGGADPDPISGLCPACNCAENSLMGQMFIADGVGDFGGALDVPAAFSGLRVWRDTSIANGGQLDIAPGILGYEWDASPDDLSRPAGLIKLSETTINWSGILTDQGNTVLPGSATHNLSIYRAPSGALVFGAGTVFWSWGLSNAHDSSPYSAQIANLDIQQFTVNMFADMGIQPGVTDAVLMLQGLIRATQSLDLVAATTTLVDIPDTVAALSTVVISGTATDDDGNAATPDGQVAVVEVSLDGGTTWRVATTTDNWATWTYNWTPTAQGVYTIRARAIDDSLNVVNVTPSQDVVTVTAPELPETFGVFDAADIVTGFVYNDNTSIELGMRFSVNTPGAVTELKYWRAELDAGDTDVRAGHLWSASGTLLATVTFTSVAGATGWQVAQLSTPVDLVAGAEYVVSYRTENNYFAAGGFFAEGREVAFDGLDNGAFSGIFGVVSAFQSGGVFHYGGGAPVMPTQTYASANYWVDVTFDPVASGANTAPVITSPAAFTIAEGLLQVGNITATDAETSILFYSIAGGADAARFTINSSTGALSFLAAPNFSAPTDVGADNVYNLLVSATDGIAPPVQQEISVTVIDVIDPEPGTGSHLFGPSDLPAVISTSDPTDYELGVRFTATQAGSITQLRYYRGAEDATDVDTRTLSLWDGSGNRLAFVTVTSVEGQSGWQVATLSSAVQITANTTYVASYGTVQNYAFTGGFFNTAHTGPDGILTGLGGGNGVFSAGGTGAFPTSSYNNSNYWVDVTFNPVTPENTAPVFTSSTSFLAAENQLAAALVAASDAEGNALTYTIAGGADASLFGINATTGLVSFLVAPDFELPADAGGNNVYDLIVGVSDGTAPVVTKSIAVTVTDVEDESQQPATFAGHQITAQYIFGSTPTTLFPDASASQTAIVDANPGTVEFTALPNAGPGLGNGSFGLASVDVGAQTISITFPLDAGVFSQAFVAFAPSAAFPFNGVRILDGIGTLPQIRGVTILSQQGFTNADGVATPLTLADLTITSTGIFLNMAGKGRMVDADPATAGVEASSIELQVDLNDSPVAVADSAVMAQDGVLTLASALLVANDTDADDDALSIIGVGNAQNGTVSYNSLADEIIFIPAAGFAGSTTFDYAIADGYGGTATGRVTVLVEEPAALALMADASRDHFWESFEHDEYFVTALRETPTLMDYL
ncbi:DUF4082 domain-containing protein [Paracoccaceae bacterium Fryx2]|nr:DUF4082 domain-containing protein [Paracoccaceae bacterium Fryx2]